MTDGRTDAQENPNLGRDDPATCATAGGVALRTLEAAERAARLAEATLRGPGTAFGRRLADFMGSDTNGRLLPAEQRLLDASRLGQSCNLETDDMRQARADAVAAMQAPSFAPLTMDVLVARGALATGWDASRSVWTPPPLPDDLRRRIASLPPLVHDFFDEVCRFVDGHPRGPKSWSDQTSLVAVVQPLVQLVATRYLYEVRGWRSVPAGDPACRVRASVLRCLCMGLDPLAPVHEVGILLENAWIDGMLDLSGAKVDFALAFFGCRFDDGIRLVETRTKLFAAFHSRIASFQAPHAKIDGSILFAKGTRIDGEAALTTSTISGNCDFTTSTLRSAGDCLRLTGADVKGELNLISSDIAGGETSVIDAKVGNSVAIEETLLRSRSCAFNGNRLEVRGSVVMRRGFSAIGEIGLAGSRIASTIELSDATLDCGGQTTLSLANATIGGRAAFSPRFSSYGLVDLLGSKIIGDVVFDGATLVNKRLAAPPPGIDPDDRTDGIALRLDRADLGGSVFLRRGFSADGEVRLATTRIKGDLALDNAKFRNSRPLQGGRARAEGRADYGLKASSAQIDGILWMAPGGVPNDKPTRMEGSVDLRGAHVATLLIDTDSFPQRTVVADDGTPLTTAIVLDGLTYDHLNVRGRSDIETAVNEMLDRQPEADRGIEFRPQPFEQAVKVFRAMGREEAAKQLVKRKASGQRLRSRLIADRRMKAAMARPEPIGWRTLRLLAWPITVPLAILRWTGSKLAGFAVWLTMDWFLGRGYNRSKPAIAAVALLLIGTALYIPAARDGLFVPADKTWAQNPENRRACAGVGQNAGPLADINFATCVTRPNALTPFHPLVYSLDLMIPFSSLGERRDWKIDTSRSAIVAPWGFLPTEVPGTFIYGWSIFQAYAALALYALLIAFIAGTIKKE